MSALMCMDVAVLTMTSREIAELTQKRHDHVLRDIEGLLTVLGETSPQIWGDLPDGYGRPQRVAYLSKELTITLVSGYSIQMRHAIVCRWQELEARQAPALPNFADPVAAARAWADEREVAQKAAAQLEVAKPKVEFFDKVVARDTLLTATQVAQSLGMSAIRLNKHLDELGFYSLNVKRARVFKQWVIDKGYGEVKQTEQGFSQPLFTTTGQAWVVERLISEGTVAV